LQQGFTPRRQPQMVIQMVGNRQAIRLEN
jgi:hypothetical protein